MSAYHKRLTGTDQRAALAAARAWSVWEASTSFLHSNQDSIRKWGEDQFALAVARIECHYFVNRGFLRSETQLLDDVQRIRHIPATIVQGRYDIVCPATSAWDLHRVWPEADFRMVPDAGHSAFEPGNVHELVLGDRSVPQPLMRCPRVQRPGRAHGGGLPVAAVRRGGHPAVAISGRLARSDRVQLRRAICGRSARRAAPRVRLTSHPGLELFAQVLARWTADRLHGPVRRRRTGVRHAVRRRRAAAAHLLSRNGPAGRSLGLRQSGLRVDARRHARYCSARRATAYNLTRLRALHGARGGGAATPLPMPLSGAGHYSPDGKRIVYSPLWRDFRSEKRYQGGWANDLYIFDLEHPQLVRVTEDPRTDRDPMWIGSAIYFNSDRSGVFNLYRYDIATRQTAQVTHYADWDVRWPSADADGQIVYELDGELHVYDTRVGSDRKLAITVPTDDTTHRPQAVNAADNVESESINPLGERLAIVARGDVFTVPVEHGVTRNLTHSSNAHEREAAWSNDGKRLAFVSDQSGEDEVYVQVQDGSAPPAAVTSNSKGRYYAPRWAGDDRRIAVADQTGRLYVIDIAAKRRIEIAKDPLDLALDYQWSPDGRFLGYTLGEANGYSGVFIWSAAEGVSRRVTPEFFNAQSPSWAPNGELLYFLSAREYAPLISTVEFNFATDRQIGIFALALRRGVNNPFGVRDDEPGDEQLRGGKDGAQEEDKEEDKADGKDGTRDKDGARDQDDARGRDKAKSKPAVKIEFDGIMQRAIRVPVDADDLSELRVSDETLLYQRNGPFNYGRESSVKTSVVAYSIKDREAKTVAEDVTAWSVTADGKHVLAQLSSKEIKYYEVGKSDDSKSEDAEDGLAGGPSDHAGAGRGMARDLRRGMAPLPRLFLCREHAWLRLAAAARTGTNRWSMTSGIARTSTT